LTDFTPLPSLFGGMLIGLAAVLLMATHGRIAGMTGILTAVIPPAAADWAWRAAFLAGAVIAPVLVTALSGTPVAFHSTTPLPWLVAGGFLVGIGVHVGSGCTSGHGVCGIARLSPRSIAATLVFMAATAATVFVVRHIAGGL
jgi:uncharacterized membrane protein YedE/YeeE